MDKTQGVGSLKERTHESMVTWQCSGCDVIFDCQIILMYYNVEEAHIQLLIYALESLIPAVKFISV